MRKFSRFLVSAMFVLTLASGLSMTACFPQEYHDVHGNRYRHERWHEQHVYQHEDGRWYARSNNSWVVVADVRP